MRTDLWKILTTSVGIVVTSNRVSGRHNVMAAEWTYFVGQRSATRGSRARRRDVDARTDVRSQRVQRDALRG